MAPKRHHHLLVKDEHDPNDFYYPPNSERLLKRVPKKVDLRPLMPPVFDQGNLPACTAHAMAAAIHSEERKLKSRATIPSRRYIYYHERLIRGEKKLRPNLTMRNALKVAAKLGACPEKMYPYSDSKRVVLRKPPDESHAVAARHRIAGYYRLSHEFAPKEQFLHHLKSCLASRHPVVFGMKLHLSFKQPPTGRWKGGVMPTPGHEGDQECGGHAVIAVGYDDRKKAVLVRNSWGKSWGEKGYFWMPYELITDPRIAYDFWTVRGIPN